MNFIEAFILLRDAFYTFFAGVWDFVSTPQTIFGGQTFIEMLVYVGPAAIITALIVKVLSKDIFSDLI